MNVGTHSRNEHFDVNQNIFELKHILFLIHTSPSDVTSAHSFINKTPALCKLLIDVILPPLCLVCLCHFNYERLLKEQNTLILGGIEASEDMKCSGFRLNSLRGVWQRDKPVF